MEEAIKEQAAAVSANNKSKLRYPLRSANKSKEENSRGRPISTVSKSVGVLDLSGKEKSAKPPRRLSIPAKSTVSASKHVGNITPISEARTRRSNNDQVKSETPASDISRLASRKKFNVLSSASYWLSQIKLSESAAKHSISLGFFKLALEAGCEPVQRIRDELKSYVRRHNLGELGEAVKELFESYNISENPEQVQISESCAQVLEEGTRSSDDEVRSSSSTVGARRLKPKSLNTDATEVSSVTVSAEKETPPKNNPAPRTRTYVHKNSADTKSVSETGGRRIQKKLQKPTKLESNKEKERMKKQGKKSASEKGPVSHSPATDKVGENKENVDGCAVEEISASEVM